MEIAALVSGGVDSSVVVHQLKEAGYDPTIFYIRIGMEDKDGYIDCRPKRISRSPHISPASMDAGSRSSPYTTSIGIGW